MVMARRLSRRGAMAGLMAMLARTSWAVNARFPFLQNSFLVFWHAARIRREYRRIAAEKKRLQLAGVDPELVRLLCRHMVNPANKKAEERFWDAHLVSLQQKLF